MVFLPEGDEAPSGSSASSEVQSGKEFIGSDGSVAFSEGLPKRHVCFQKALL
jgi:hypothetical protein